MFSLISLLVNFFEKNSLITPDISSLLKKGIQTLKSVNLDFRVSIFQFFFNFNTPLEFSVESYKIFQNTLAFIFKKRFIKMFKNSSMSIFANFVKF
jgi:hypothetical protein